MPKGVLLNKRPGVCAAHPVSHHPGARGWPAPLHCALWQSASQPWALCSGIHGKINGETKRKIDIFLLAGNQLPYCGPWRRETEGGPHTSPYQVSKCAKKKAISKLILNLLFREMMDQFVLDLTSEWKALGLPLNPKLGACQPASCAYCRCSATKKFLLIKLWPLKLVLFRQPAEFARLAARECPLASTGRACPLGELATVAA